MSQNILIFPTFCSEIAWMTYVISWERYLTTAEKPKESFLSLLLLVVGKAADLTNFDRCRLLRADRSEGVPTKLHDLWFFATGRY